MTDSWYIAVDRIACPYYFGGICSKKNNGVGLRECCRENCLMRIIEKDDLLKENRTTD